MFGWFKAERSRAKINELLAQLKEEREKFTQADKDKMQDLVDQLVKLGVYPEKSKSGCSALRMVEGHGVDWYTWRQPYFCRHCDADLRNHEAGPPYKREIGEYDMTLDRTVGFKCPDCGKILAGREA